MDELISKLITYIANGKEWIFSGIGVTIILLLFNIIFKKRNTSLSQSIKSGNNSQNIQSGKNLRIKQK